MSDTRDPRHEESPQEQTEAAEPKRPMTRRSVLAGAGALGALAVAPRAQAQAREPEESAAAEFPQGVASGDPTASQVILWTRAVPSGTTGPAQGGEASVHGRWQIAADEQFRDIVQNGRFEARSRNDWTAKVDVSGLDADRWYWYRFQVGESTSRVGRTRTLPRAGVERFRMGVFSCSNLPFGFFHAYRHAAERDDLDLVLHLGDYIYEYGAGGYGADVAERIGRTFDPPHEILTVDDYRRRYAQYRSDADLQEIHARYPMIVVWDDHEIANNTWHSGAQNHQEDEGSFLDRKASAVQVYHEWLPTRARSGEAAEEIYRTFDIGDLASLIMLDTRLVGRDQQIDYGDLAEAGPGRAEELAELIASPDRSMLGVEQEAWLKVELANSKRRGIPWQVLGQQLLVGGLKAPDFLDLLGPMADRGPGRTLKFMVEHDLPLNTDAWDGYGAARERLAHDALAHGDNVVVLAGDTHNAWAFDLLDESGRCFGVEMGTPSVTSAGLERLMPLPPTAVAERLLRANPHLRWADTSQRGYLTLELTRERATGTWWFVGDVTSDSTSVAEGKRATVVASEGPGSKGLELS